MAVVTVLWLVERGDVPRELDDRYQHVVGDPERPAATITRLLSEGPVVAVVRSDEEGERALSLGVDEVVLLGQLGEPGFDQTVHRTVARARGRMLRDLWLIDMVRKDDTLALELLSNALGAKLGEPLERVARTSERLLEDLGGEAPEAASVGDIASSVRSLAGTVERMQALLDTQPTDEVVDLREVAKEVAESLSASVGRAARFAVDVVDQPCHVGVPRWQVVLMIASLVANAVEAIHARGEGQGEVGLRVTLDEGTVVLEVSDDGVGMDTRVRVHASEPFFSTERDSRLGLGLSMVSARVRRAGGELMIDSEPGVGTTVRVYLPLLGAKAPLSTGN